MIRTAEWKYIFYEGFRPQLFHLAEDPMEQNDLGEDPAHAAQSALLHEKLFQWLRNRRMGVMPDAVADQRTGKAKERGFVFGVW